MVFQSFALANFSKTNQCSGGFFFANRIFNFSGFLALAQVVGLLKGVSSLSGECEKRVKKILTPEIALDIPYSGGGYDLPLGMKYLL